MFVIVFIIIFVLFYNKQFIIQPSSNVRFRIAQVDTQTNDSSVLSRPLDTFIEKWYNRTNTMNGPERPIIDTHLFMDLYNF